MAQLLPHEHVLIGVVQTHRLLLSNRPASIREGERFVHFPMIRTNFRVDIAHEIYLENVIMIREQSKKCSGGGSCKQLLETASNCLSLMLAAAGV